mmetsp:Transcript_4343/g.13105  ORF Transcript_4343/g.13105 Transcript_4343/m.13105 type:complete len:308 (-) Transcript_4343:64-987(-)
MVRFANGKDAIIDVCRQAPYLPHRPRGLNPRWVRDSGGMGPGAVRVRPARRGARHKGDDDDRQHAPLHRSHPLGQVLRPRRHAVRLLHVALQGGVQAGDARLRAGAAAGRASAVLRPRRAGGADHGHRGGHLCRGRAVGPVRGGAAARGHRRHEGVGGGGRDGRRRRRLDQHHARIGHAVGEPAQGGRPARDLPALRHGRRRLAHREGGWRGDQAAVQGRRVPHLHRGGGAQHGAGRRLGPRRADHLRRVPRAVAQGRQHRGRRRGGEPVRQAARAAPEVMILAGPEKEEALRDSECVVRLCVFVRG